MKRRANGLPHLWAALGVAIVVVAACSSDCDCPCSDTDAFQGTDVSDASAPGDVGGSDDVGAPTDLTAATDAEDGVGTDTGPADDASNPTDTGDSGGTGGFAFDELDPQAYTRVDRAGRPAVNLLFITSKDSYNEADPADDVNLAFGSEVIAVLQALHNALDDDLTGLGLAPCTVFGDGSGTCIAQLAPLVMPDTLRIAPAEEAGFPNGRGLDDPALDIMLAVALLDLSVHSPGLFASLPLNPPANDVAFQASFPYVAPPHGAR